MAYRRFKKRYGRRFPKRRGYGRRSYGRRRRSRVMRKSIGSRM